MEEEGRFELEVAEAVNLQLGMAIDSPKATLCSKKKAQDNIAVLPLQDGWGKKHQLFIKWKFLESKAAAYYFHGLILDEGNTEKSHRAAAAALHASEEYEMVGLEQSIGELKIIHVAGTKGKSFEELEASNLRNFSIGPTPWKNSF
ncbi:hypothetical protein FCM35_KLT02149 [Carex littledalei]|uniref:Uncharacterized protein n=1 Tax=Carex littledalei TaxID=544730 RepID=A0A833R6J5_9POAL|nr:hypothetical protein FCM35_KLT02149 [Carex littledalei]